ncbi:MAG: PAS domain S-box protein [Halorhodospira sp.]
MSGEEQRVLVVDDEKGNRQLLADVLRGEAKVVLAKNGEQALARVVDAPPPDLILLDILLPDMDGYEVLHRLNQDPRTQPIPVIFVTGLDNEEDEEKGLELGAIDYIPKPFRPAIIRARVRNHLTYVRQQKEAESAREHFRSILESSPVGIAFLDSDRRFQEVNPATEELVGRSAEEILGKKVNFLYRDRSEFERVGREAYGPMSAGGVYHTETTFERPDGTPVIVAMCGRAVNPAALEEGFIWVLQDITEQRARERTLEQYRAVFENSRDAVLLIDETGFYVDCNPAAVALFQVPDRASLVGSHPIAYSPATQPDGQSSEEKARELIRKAFDEGVAFFEWTVLFGGELVPVEILLSRIDLDTGPILETVIRDITEQKQAFEQIRRARDRAETYFELVRVMMLVLDTDGRVAAINQRGCEILSLERAELMGADWFLRFVPDSDREQVVRIFEDLRAGREGIAEFVENTILTATGERRVLAFHNTVLRDGEGRVESILASGEDVTHRRQLEAEQHLLATAFQTSQALMITDAGGTIERVNPAFTQVTGYEPSEVIGTNPKILASGEHDADFYAALWRQLLEQDHWEGEVWDRRKNGEIYPQWESITAVRDERGEVARYVAVFHEITEQKRLETELERLATHDPLTGIYNRAKLYELLESARREKQRYGTPFAVVLFDIDNFKAINDTYGHGAGDSALRELTERVQSVLRDTDHFGRWGGEEFLILADHTNRAGAEHLAERIRQMVADEPFSMVGAVTVSLGLAEMQAGESLEHLEERADEALYGAKAEGRNRVVTD